VTLATTRAAPLGFYVYLHVRNDTGNVFYVGKGKGRRAWIASKRNRYHQAMMQKLDAAGSGWRVEIFEDGLSNEEAFTKEKEIISAYGRESLTNLSDGGEYGAVGHKMPRHIVEALAAKARGRKMPRHGVEKSAAARRGVKLTEDMRKRMSEGLKGKKHSSERNARKSLRQTGKPVSPHMIEAMNVATRIPVICHETGTIYASASEAARQMGLLRECVRDTVSGRQKSTGGFTFSRIEQTGEKE
jgi:hypothetical protein